MIIRNPLILTCINCQKEYSTSSIKYECSECDGLLFFKPDLTKFKNKFIQNKNFDKFWDFKFALPKIEETFIVTLGEGGSSCRMSKKIGEILGLKELFFKDETQNPTNSFKDRAGALLISHARSWDFQKAICASNGNQGASIAAYTSLEGMECINIIPEEIDIGKRAQLIAYNSKIVVNGNTVDSAIRDALDKKYIDYYQATPEYNPLTIEAQKTIAYEIYSQIGAPNWIIIPMGSGGLLVSIWKGFTELKESGVINTIPRLVGVQSQACAPIVKEFNDSLEEYNSKKEKLSTKALSIMVRNPLYHAVAVKAIKESKGIALSIPENLILTSAEDLARNEGIFAEPASASTIAAINMLMQQEKIKADEKIVCLITGSGLKTPHVLEAISSRAKTVGTGGILSTKLKILSQISLSENKGIYGSKLKDIIGSISLAAIYQHLKDLESKNLISRKKAGKNVLYFITENGKKVLDALDILITLL